MTREPAVPFTWRGVEDRSCRACAGAGSGLAPQYLRRPSVSGPRRGDEESGKFTGLVSEALRGTQDHEGADGELRYYRDTESGCANRPESADRGERVRRGVEDSFV